MFQANIARSSSRLFRDAIIDIMKICTVYIRGSDIYVVASAKNTFGIFQDSEPFFKVSVAIPPHELGATVLQALESYRENVPGKTYVRGVKQALSPFLVFSGFRSWRAFEKEARHFLISINDSKVEVTPSVPRQKGGGYLHQPERAVRCPGQASEIGNILLEQMSRP